MTAFVIPGARRALPTPLTQAEKDAIGAAAVAANTAAFDTRVTALENLATETVYHVNGSAANGGDGSLAAPFNNSDDLIVAGLGRVNRINILGAFTWTSYVSTLANMQIGFYGIGGDQTLTFGERANGQHAGFQMGGFTAVRFQDVGVKVNMPNNLNDPVFDAYGGGYVSSWWFSSSLEFITGGEAFMYRALYGGALSIFFQGTTLTNSGGHVFSGVATGADPNVSAFISTNLTSN